MHNFVMVNRDFLVYKITDIDEEEGNVLNVNEVLVDTFGSFPRMKDIQICGFIILPINEK